MNSKQLQRVKLLSLLYVAIITALVGLFLFVGFFIGIVFYSYALDLLSHRIDFTKISMDLIWTILWLSILPIILYFKNKYKLL